jgi:hypothetical protein
MIPPIPPIRTSQHRVLVLYILWLTSGPLSTHKHPPRHYIQTNKTNSVGFIPQANYTKLSTADAAGEVNADFWGQRLLNGQRHSFLCPLISVFWTEAANFSFK